MSRPSTSPSRPRRERVIGESANGNTTRTSLSACAVTPFSASVVPRGRYGRARGAGAGSGRGGTGRGGPDRAGGAWGPVRARVALRSAPPGRLPLRAGPGDGSRAGGRPHG